MPASQTQPIEGSRLKRSLVLEAGQRHINEEARTVEVAFSSEAEVPRHFGIEILDHDSTSVRLGRLQEGGAVLVDHAGDQVGVVDSVRIDADRRGRAVLRFGKGVRASEVFQDVLDDIRRHISVGYLIHKYERTDGEGGAPDTVRITDWEPYEISIVSVPADVSAGVGRSQTNLDNEEGGNMPDSVETQENADTSSVSQTRSAAPVTAPAVVDVNAVRQEERQRVASINEAVQMAPFDLGELGTRAINEGMTLDQFRAAAFEVAAKQPQPAAAVTSADMLERHDGDYSLVRAINAQLTGDWSQAGFEKEMSQELVRMAQSEGGGINGGLMVPMTIFGQGQRSNTTDSAGLIPTAHAANQFIDVLKANTMMGRLGARFLPGLNGNVSIPKKTASATFGWIGENDNAPSSNVTVGNVKLSPKHIGGKVPLTFELLRQSNPAIESLVRSDMLEGIALAIDRAAFIGDGVGNNPLGILNTAGVQTLTVADATNKVPTFEEVVAMEGLVDDVEGLIGQLAYLFRPGIHSKLKTTVKDAGSGQFVIQGGDCNGYTPYKSSQMPDKGSLFGDFSQVMIGTWGMVELLPERNIDTGGLDIGCHQLADVVTRRPEQFVKTI